MRAALRAASAHLIVGHLDATQAADLLSTVDGRGRPIMFSLAEPEGLRQAALVPAGMAAEAARSEPVRWGKLVIETAANEATGGSRKEMCDAVVDGLRVAHRRLGPEGLDLVPAGSSGVGFCAALMAEASVQLVIVPPAQVFVVHQGVALSVPESSEVGRDIWMRDDLRAELFAGIGGPHDPDIRVYDAPIGPGDSLVLASSSLARMLTEEDVRLAVGYEDAGTGAERLKQLAIQRGVEAGLALVVEISGVLQDDPPSPAAGPILLSGLPRPALRLEMPPIGSIFSTARDWLLEAVDRVQPAGRAEAPSGQRDRDELEVTWPVRPRPGAWRTSFEAAKRIAVAGHAPDQALMPDVASDQDDQVAAERAELSKGWRHYARAGAPRPHLPLSSLQVGPGLQRAGAVAANAVAAAVRRVSAADLSAKRHVLVPALGMLVVLLVFLGAVRMVKGQQARQVQQRFDSLATAAAQLETQARSAGDRNEAQGLVRRSQALLDQAATLQPNQPRLAAIRKDLQADLERLDNILVTDPKPIGSFAAAGKDVSSVGMVLDGSVMYALDPGGQRLLQLSRQTNQASVAASKGDKTAANQLGTPKLLAIRDGSALVLDSSRNLWSYSPSSRGLQQVGLKSADSWKEPAAIAVYGPNLYVLDATVGNVFRYVSRDGLFTEPPARLFEKDPPDVLRQGVSLAIDGSVWVLTADGQILKVESGARQPFAISGMPQPFGKPSQIATQPGFHSLYVLDTGSGRVVEIAKDGRYVRQFKLSLASPLTGFWPDEAAQQLYVLSGNTVYQSPLPS